MDYGAVHIGVGILNRNFLFDGVTTYIRQAWQGHCASCIIRHVNISVGMSRYRTVAAASHKREYVCRT